MANAEADHELALAPTYLLTQSAWSGEFGAMFLLDVEKGILTTYAYGGLGGGLGAGVAKQVELGLVVLGSPDDLTGWGVQVGAFAAAGVGPAGSGFVSLPAPSATGTAGGGALGAGAAVGLQGTFTTMEATYNLSNVPSGIAMTIAPLIPYIPLLFKTP